MPEADQTNAPIPAHPVRNFFERLKKSTFFKNVLVVMSGAAVAQAIGFLLSPVVSRLYSPADFGVFGSFNAVIAVIVAGVTLDFTQALMLPKSKKDAANLFMVACLATAGVSVCCLLVYLLRPGLFLKLINTTNAWIPVLMVFAVLISGLSISFRAWCVRVKAFKHTSASQVIRTLSSSGTQIGLGFMRGGPAGLICGTIVGVTLSSLNMARVVLPDLRQLRRDISWARMKQMASEYRDFPFFSAPQNILNALSRGLPVLLLNHYYGIAVAGAYAFGMRILHVPMGFVLGALRQVLFQRAGETQYEGGRLTPLYLKSTGGLFVAAILPALVLFIWSPKIFSFIFGDQWYVAGEIARFLVLWMLFVFCNLPALLFAKIIRLQRYVFIYEICLLVMRLTALVLGGIYLNAMHTVMLLAVVGAAMNAGLILFVGNAVIKKEKAKVGAIDP